jgi:hypothetical protein
MNQTKASTELIDRAGAPPVTDTRLSGRWLILARITWFVVVLPTLVLFVMSMPLYFAHLQTPCLTTSCSFGQLSPVTIQALSARGLFLNVYTLFIIILTAILALVGLTSAALLLWKKSDNWMALLIAFWLAMLGLSGGGGVGELSALLGPGLANVLYNCYSFLGSVCVILIFCLFPNGRFVPRWMRWLVVFTIVVSAYFSIFQPSPSSVFETLSGALWFSLLGSVAFAQLYRYLRVSTPVERQQTKWVVFSLALGGIIGIGLYVPELIWPTLRYGSLYDIVGNVVPSFCFNLLLALSFGIAILRYRLYDIDLLIRRTLIYGTLTIFLTLVYVGLILLLQTLLQGLIGHMFNSDIVIVISTLVIAALFQPVRRRIQAIIDRRFYRRKYDAAKTVEAFSATLRHKVDLTELSEHLVAVVQETMQPSHVSLWLRPSEHNGNQRAAWRATFPVSSEGK